MKRLILVGLKLLCVPIFLAAADEVGVMKSKGFGGVIVGAIYNPGITDINKALETYGFPKLSDISLGIGGIGLGVINKGIVISGFGLINIPSTTETKINNTNIIATMSGGYGFFEIGYDLIGGDNILLSPILGLGGGGAYLSFSVRDDKTLDFDEIVKNPISRTSGVGYGDFGVELGILFLLTGVNVFEREGKYNDSEVKGKGSIDIGIKVSYFHIFQVNDTSVTGEPQYSGHNIFASLLIGFSGSSSRSHQKKLS